MLLAFRVPACVRITARHITQDPAEIDVLRLPVIDGSADVELVHPADHFLEIAEAQLRHNFSQFFGDEEEVTDHVFRHARETRPEHRILRRDADRAGVQMALPHHHTAGGHKRGGGKTEFVGAQQCADSDVPARAETAVNLDRDTAAKAIETQGLLRFGQADFPWRAGVGQRG